MPTLPIEWVTDVLDVSISYLWRWPFNEVVDKGPLFVTDHHPGPLVRLQPQGLQGELLQEVDPGIPGLAQKFHLTLALNLYPV